MDKTRFYLEADMVIHKETDTLREAASSIIKLPEEKDKQPDLLYFSAIFVSSGENLNHAYFLPNELVQAEGTIVNKALDVEHNENEIIGHLYDRAFIDKDGNRLELADLKEKANTIDTEDVHVAIAGVIYKNRFPNLASEVSEKTWRVSMECYYQDYDIKVGDLIIDKQEAEVLGVACKKQNIFGKTAKVIKGGVKVAEGAVTRVLRGIIFSGCGIVKNPANPPSVILETANNNSGSVMNQDEIIVLDYDKLEKSNDVNNVTIINMEDTLDKDTSELVYDDSVGICVYFRKRVLDSACEGPNTKVLHNNWCTLCDTECSSFSRDTTDPNCLRNKDVKSSVGSYLGKLISKKEYKEKQNLLVVDLELALGKADKALSN
jgi:hypothetical protein